MWIALLVLLFTVPESYAGGGLPLDPGSFADPSKIVDPTLVKVATRTVGIALSHRPYQPATALGTNIGLDLSVEATMAQIPKDFNDALSAVGVNSSLPLMPVPRLHLHKGLGPRTDLGLSFIKYLDYSIYGGDIKFLLSSVEEGPTLAFRFNYTKASLGFVTTSTYVPELLISREIDFADPYMGLSVFYVSGEVNATVPVTVGPVTQNVTYSSSATNYSAGAFIGVAFKFGMTGVKLTMEGAYNLSGVNALGVKVGLAF